MTLLLRRALLVLSTALVLALASTEYGANPPAPAPLPAATAQQRPPARRWSFFSRGDVGAMAAVPLGTLQQFGVLGGSAVTAAVVANVTGDVGSCPNAAISGAGLNVVPPFIKHLTNVGADAVVCTAHADAQTAFGALFAQAGGATGIGNQLGGTSLGTGVYSLGAGDIAGGTTLTLNGPGTFVFLMASSLTANTTSNVVLNNVNPCDVYWAVTSSATISGSNFPGTVIANIAVTIDNGAGITGRAAALNSFVTMSGPVNNVGGCSSVVVVPPPSPSPGASPSPPPVPALPEVGFLSLLALLVAGGVFVLRRH